MRIISGKYKGKKLDGFDINGTRPTMDRVKESIFGIIQNDIKNSVFLDLFAGSGSVGIEALSNGAKECYFVDNSKEALKILNKNLEGVSGGYIINNDYKNFLKTTNNKFDIIFLDPPYKANLINKCINIIIEKELLNDNGLIICEYETEHIDDVYELIREKKYGSKSIKIFKK